MILGLDRGRGEVGRERWLPLGKASGAFNRALPAREREAAILGLMRQAGLAMRRRGGRTLIIILVSLLLFLWGRHVLSCAGLVHSQVKSLFDRFSAIEPASRFHHLYRLPNFGGESVRAPGHRAGKGRARPVRREVRS